MKRLVAAPLWFLVGWYLGSVAAWSLGLGPWLAPIVAVSLAALIVADPWRVIWDRGARNTQNPAAMTASVDASRV
jgi:membrane protein DedA with SNARE-associated domain